MQHDTWQDLIILPDKSEATGLLDLNQRNFLRMKVATIAEVSHSYSTGNSFLKVRCQSLTDSHGDSLSHRFERPLY